MDGRTWIAGHGLQDMYCRIQIAGHRYGHGSQDMDTDMDRRTWITRLVSRTGIAGHGHGHELQDMDTDMDCRTWTRTWVRNSKGKEFKSHRYIVYPV